MVVFERDLWAYREAPDGQTLTAAAVRQTFWRGLGAASPGSGRHPPDDADRAPWLATLRDLIATHLRQPARHSGLFGAERTPSPNPAGRA
ncbi:MAG: hypothetical protein RMN24_14405 [Anaerolineae bacterium]|nr:hypothetical protein [Caldilineales bacterium]MDW8270349.1 hypothetical protein [Anaerolineae bacterium]